LEGKFTMPAKNVKLVGSWTAIPKYTVSYEYIGVVPANAPEAPVAAQYEAEAEVTLAEEPRVGGYIFSGWTTEDVEIEDNKFAMPEQDVKLIGSWRRKTLPVIPVNPPVTPITPIDPPVTPVTPVTPEIPEIPEVPETPVTPEIPEAPETPAVPEAPETPEVPETAEEPIEIPEEDVPLVELPEEIVEIAEEDVPLADVPKTDDKLALYVTLALLSGTGLVWLAVEDKKRKTI